MRCQGWIRTHWDFSFPALWYPCKNDATQILTLGENEKNREVQSCVECWNEAVKLGIKYLGVRMI